MLLIRANDTRANDKHWNLVNLRVATVREKTLRCLGIEGIIILARKYRENDKVQGKFREFKSFSIKLKSTNSINYKQFMVRNITFLIFIV